MQNIQVSMLLRTDKYSLCPSLFTNIDIRKMHVCYIYIINIFELKVHFPTLDELGSCDAR